MARGVTRRPARGALQKIPFTWQSNSDREAAHILAQHNEATQRRTQGPTQETGVAAMNPVNVRGVRVGGSMGIRGGVFSPRSNIKFI